MLSSAEASFWCGVGVLSFPLFNLAALFDFFGVVGWYSVVYLILIRTDAWMVSVVCTEVANNL